MTQSSRIEPLQGELGRSAARLTSMISQIIIKANENAWHLNIN